MKLTRRRLFQAAIGLASCLAPGPAPASTRHLRAILATTRVDHLRQKMAAGYGRLPDASMRNSMVACVESLSS